MLQVKKKLNNKGENYVVEMVNIWVNIFGNTIWITWY